MNAARKIITSILIALFFLPSYAQEFKTKKVITGKYLEIFTIDKKSKLKNGEYLKIDSDSKDTLTNGTFRDDLKTGIWRYRRYSSKGTQPWITYDYDKNILTRISDQTSKVDSFMIRKGDSFVMEKVDATPVYLGFKDELKSTLEMNFRVPTGIAEQGSSVVSIASFNIDIDGKMKNLQIVMSSSKDVNANILEAFKMFESEWSPAIFHGQPVESKIYAIFDIKPKGTSSVVAMNPNAILIDCQYSRVVRQVVGRVVKVKVVPYGNGVGIPQGR
jgi:hypothetical protein